MFVNKLFKSLNNLGLTGDLIWELFKVLSISSCLKFKHLVDQHFEQLV